MEEARSYKHLAHIKVLTNSTTYLIFGVKIARILWQILSDQFLQGLNSVKAALVTLWYKFKQLLQTPKQIFESTRKSVTFSRKVLITSYTLLLKMAYIRTKTRLMLLETQIVHPTQTN